jgi:phosphatidylserine decarboxylase
VPCETIPRRKIRSFVKKGQCNYKMVEFVVVENYEKLEEFFEI